MELNPQNDFSFGTKAETLARLAARLSVAKALPSIYFSVREWHEDSVALIEMIKRSFSGDRLVVRSSAKHEDGAESSMAGAFVSQLDVSRTFQGIEKAVLNVIASFHGNADDQVLVQEMVTDTVVSGVITTYALGDGAPYYVLNYDDKSGKTDTITGGKGETNKTVIVYRNMNLSLIESQRVRSWVEMAVELERVCRCDALDIEFGQRKNGELVVFQVRRIAGQQSWDLGLREQVFKSLNFIHEFTTERSRRKVNLAGDTTILGIMPDWNPAEIIGTTPRPLANSLYQYLITRDVWREARGEIGYFNPTPEQLMINIAGRPFIDVRNSFNSFLPAELAFGIREKLVNAWLKRLSAHPEFHDKVEFEIAQTVFDFTFEPEFERRYAGVLTDEEQGAYFAAIRNLTARNLDVEAGGPMRSALGSVAELERRQAGYRWTCDSEMDLLANIERLLIDCRELGCLPFAIVARHAFMAEACLRSAVRLGVLREDWLHGFKMNLSTVTSDMSSDLQKVFDGAVSREVFFAKYGHLRPGTYDIQSLRYDQRPDLFMTPALPRGHVSLASEPLSEKERANVAGLLAKQGLGHLSPEQFFEFCKLAIVGREHAKFVFTKNLSDALELIAQWGQRLGLSREDLSYLTIDEILEQLVQPILNYRQAHFRALTGERRREVSLSTTLCLSYIIRDTDDLYVVPLHRGAPNFVTTKWIEGRTVLLDSRMSKMPELKGAIVCIENADPGFDWIFTRGIGGLVTKFGGSNSHMAIRCAEFGLPAAIGCGEQTFQRLVDAGRVVLNCEAKILRPVYG